MICLPALIAAYVVITTSLLGGCSDAPVTGARGNIAAPARTGDRTAVHTATANLGERFANAALDDRWLGQIRGGLDAGPGVVLSFAFQEATYINHNLAQSVVVPTIMISPSSGTASMASTSPALSSINNPAVSSIILTRNSAPQMQVSSSPAAGIIQSLVNGGMKSIVSSLDGGGVTNVISNTANNQLVQQIISANIGVTGLPQLQQESVLSTVTNRLAPANSQFR